MPWFKSLTTSSFKTLDVSYRIGYNGTGVKQVRNASGEAHAKGQPIENKEGTQPWRGVSFLFQKWFRRGPGQMTPILMSMSVMLSASRDMC